jgi:hypothetical protein
VEEERKMIMMIVTEVGSGSRAFVADPNKLHDYKTGESDCWKTSVTSQLQ